VALNDQDVRRIDAHMIVKRDWKPDAVLLRMKTMAHVPDES
jgi:hypothetical protein